MLHGHEVMQFTQYLPTNIGWSGQDHDQLDCSTVDCDLCTKIKEAAGNKWWCFKWIEELRDMEKVEADVDCDLQVRLLVNPPDAQISHIRIMLANLQMKMPCWSLLDDIKEYAQNMALRESRGLVKEKFRNGVWRPAQKCSCEQCISNGGRLAQKCICQYCASDEDIEELKRRKNTIANNLTNFVAQHVLLMLKKLYDTIQEVQKSLQSEEFPSEIMPSSKKWLREIYLSRNKNASVKNLVFGPVGERPLHVCALSAYRFNDIKFENERNYVQDGIINGMRIFVKEHEELEDIWVPYGKDYCAAIGTYLSNGGEEKWPKNAEPPFWSKLIKWYREHTLRDPDDSTLTAKPSEIQQITDMKTMVTVGVYEGETILLPMIAARDIESVHWVLNCPDDVSDKKGNKKGTLVSLAFEGLFFRPMHRRQLTTFSVLKGWQYYVNLQSKDQNVEASSRKSYFGLNVLSFAASQGNTEIFDLIFKAVHDLVIRSLKTRVKTDPEDADEIREIDDQELIKMAQKAILNGQDEFGNTLLHLAAWNNKPEMYDRLIQMGAEARIKNENGLNPFTLCARYGIWPMFNHIWDKHMTNIVWRFGNVEKIVMNHTTFDWKGLVNFESRGQAMRGLSMVIEHYDRNSEPKTLKSAKEFWERLAELKKDQGKSLDLCEKVTAVSQIVQKWREMNLLSAVKKVTDEVLHQNFYMENGYGYIKTSQWSKLKDGMSAVRLISLFRPANWYDATKGKVEEVIMRKWRQGYCFVHVGQCVIPYIVVLLLFGFMWLYRELDVLEHNLWFASKKATSFILASYPDATVLSNPVKANISELKLNLQLSTFGTSLQEIVPHILSGPESSCGWSSLRNSYSGALQVCLLFYGIPSLLRLAYTQRRIRPSDLDSSQDFKISFDEVVNFIYFNLESLLHIVMCGLFLTIISARVLAGSECAVNHVRAEKNATSVACLFLFFNLFIACKPFKGIGLLILTIYRFLVSDVFNFLLMYSIFFTAFLVAIQTLHNANHVYLGWLGYTRIVFPQIQLLTQNFSYLQGANIPKDATRLHQTYMSLAGCDTATKTIYDTAFELLEISFGDGLSNALEDGRRQDYECAGFNIDSLVGYIIVFWVFLTNVLVLNMLIAMMNATFEEQSKEVHSVWLLDVSYRIMRYEKLFPELIRRLQRPVMENSFFSLEYWKSWLWDFCLVIYCCPEIHLWGLPLSIYHKVLDCICSFPCCDSSQNKFNKKTTVIEWTNLEKAGSIFKYPTRKMRQTFNQFRNSDMESKLNTFAKHICVQNQVNRWFKELDDEITVQYLKDLGDGNEKKYSKSLILVSLIFQLDLIIKSFDDSLSIPKVRPHNEILEADS